MLLFTYKLTNFKVKIFHLKICDDMHVIYIFFSFLLCSVNFGVNCVKKNVFQTQKCHSPFFKI